ncbi:cytochrome P460 family protein [Asticcacaulis benevestitus]|uniref:Cytochrome P460 domain-containing protein n=1 Tax=Asticcacaulis benevestitus DSM 16100 = ATCC BAA-896 TaxID=1121022 RepID=V4PWV5_9CAUL|nr:cytochrome P460 family protein [Asticcacaulis benevestitus]ESQ92866.1 hypothetical protein ABENE_07115 [Asticcacaulis benevestitus DSM 16100 = ATCC BAA-896]
MKSQHLLSVVAAAVLAAIILGAMAEPTPPESVEPQYDARMRLKLPADYRDWVFLSSGLDMSYSQAATMPGAHMFNNVFVPRAAYLAFKATGIWPDKTMIILENRSGAKDVSINKRGVVQTGEVMGLEAHVKDARLEGGWGFYSFDDGKPAAQIAHTAACYACHQDHAAADTTFVQFYPTLLPFATQHGTLNPKYLSEIAAAKEK